MHRCIRLAALALVISAPGSASAQRIAEYLDAVDLNEYSLAFVYYTSESPYEGVSPFRIVYPITTTFDHAIQSDSTYFYRDGHIGLRTMTDSGWSAGVVANLQTLGHSSGDSEALEGMLRRSWTAQAGLTAGKRLGKWSFDIFTSWDVLDEHNGNETELKVARMFDAGRWQMVPQVEAVYQSGDLVRHYFGVESFEARSDRPEYQPGSAVTYSVGIDFSYRFHPRWYAILNTSVEWLPSEIRQSPIVDKDSLWRVTLGVAYDSGVFQDIDGGGSHDSFLETVRRRVFRQQQLGNQLLRARTHARNRDRGSDAR